MRDLVYMLLMLIVMAIVVPIVAGPETITQFINNAKQENTVMEELQKNHKR